MLNLVISAKSNTFLRIFINNSRSFFFAFETCYTSVINTIKIISYSLFKYFFDKKFKDF